MPGPTFHVEHGSLTALALPSGVEVLSAFIFMYFSTFFRICAGVCCRKQASPVSDMEEQAFVACDHFKQLQRVLDSANAGLR